MRNYLVPIYVIYRVISVGLVVWLWATRDSREWSSRLLGPEDCEGRQCRHRR